MNNDINLLITMSNGEFLLKIAIKLPADKLSEDVLDYPLEPENKEKIFNWLPNHCQSFGKIVEVESLFEIKDYLTSN